MQCAVTATAPTAGRNRTSLTKTCRRSSIHGRAVCDGRSVRSKRNARFGSTNPTGGGHNRHVTTSAFKPMERARGQDYASAAECFVDAFFLKRNGGSDRITKGELAYLNGAQRKDLVKRYNQKNKGTMFVVKDDETNKVVGCVGVEVQKFVGNVPLRRAENDLGDVEILDRPVIANLAVASSARRKGLAKSLMREIEEEVKKWGYDETILVVESANKKAVLLYKKSGYKPIFNDKAAPNLAIDENGKVVEAKVKAVTMRKSLKEGAQGALENLDLVKVLGGVVLAGLIAYAATNGVDWLPF